MYLTFRLTYKRWWEFILTEITNEKKFKQRILFSCSQNCYCSFISSWHRRATTLWFENAGLSEWPSLNALFVFFFLNHCDSWGTCTWIARTGVNGLLPYRCIYWMPAIQLRLSALLCGANVERNKRCYPTVTWQSTQQFTGKALSDQSYSSIRIIWNPLTYFFNFYSTCNKVVRADGITLISWAIQLQKYTQIFLN
jgi:hypothetical protein